MSVWYVIVSLIVFTVVWPFVDVGFRNRRKLRERGLQKARKAPAPDA